MNPERRRKSTNPGDHRAEFERDYDRSVFSTPVKRLQDKAQVFPLEPHDAIRTRLTHSLEVASVARGIATGVSQWMLKENKISQGQDRSIEAIAATCVLIHDLGNPPFGHAGEDAIRYWFKNHIKEGYLHDQFKNEQLVQDMLLFEGNAQSLRIVSKLQILSDFYGLNLTYGTLSALCKYIAPSNNVSHDGNHAYSKPGFFASEQDIIMQIREKTGTGEARNPITFLVEAADDIVYSVADIEDSVKKGILLWREVEDEMKRVAQSNQKVQNALEGMSRILKSDQNAIPGNLPDDVYASAFRTAAIAQLVPSVVDIFQTKYDLIISGQYGNELVNDCEAAPLVDYLKKKARSSVYNTAPTLKLEIMGRKVICDLMDIFWEGAKSLPPQGEPKSKDFHGKVGLLLSQNYRRVFQHSIKEGKLPEYYLRFQLVTDYVCGMTDTFAKRLHSELTNGS